MSADLYAEPRSVESAKECTFYHVMDIPTHGVVGGQWDLRGHEDEYLGHAIVEGKRVLEIGPATGFLTFHMESRGAEVVALELSPDVDWDIVPNPDIPLEEVIATRRRGMERLRNGFWFAHERFGSKAKVHYGSAYDIPAELGRFDVAVMAAVLLHTRDPLRVMQACSSIADTIVVTELHYPELSIRQATKELFSSVEFPSSDTWWKLTPGLITRFAQMVGYPNNTVSFHNQQCTIAGATGEAAMFTVVASRGAVADQVHKHARWRSRAARTKAKTRSTLYGIRNTPDRWKRIAGGSYVVRALRGRLAKRRS